jgi:hypothetical protein
MRRHVPRPPLSVDAVNREGVVVSVIPGPTAGMADSIESVLLRRGGTTVRPFSTSVRPVKVGDDASARALTAGAFSFRLEDFATLPVTLVCVGPTSDYELEITEITDDDLFPFDTVLTDATSLQELTAAAADYRETHERQREIVEPQECCSIRKLEFEATEQNDVWIRYRWKVLIHNDRDRSQVFDLEIRFIDDKQSVVDTARLHRQRLPPLGEQAFAGFSLVRMPGAMKVASATAIITPR